MQTDLRKGLLHGDVAIISPPPVAVADLEFQKKKGGHCWSPGVPLPFSGLVVVACGPNQKCQEEERTRCDTGTSHRI